MVLEEGFVYHIYNRGNNNQRVFFTDDDYLAFLNKISNSVDESGVSILCYCLMPNHFHFLIWIPLETDIQLFKNKYSTSLSSYSQRVNKRQNRSGSLFQKRTKAKKCASILYVQTCFHYIHQNPVRAKLVNKLEDWAFSSFIEFITSKNRFIRDPEKVKNFIELPSEEKLFYEASYRVIPEWFEF